MYLPVFKDGEALHMWENAFKNFVSIFQPMQYHGATEGKGLLNKAVVMAYDLF